MAVASHYWATGTCTSGDVAAWVKKGGATRGGRQGVVGGGGTAETVPGGSVHGTRPQG